MHLIEQWMEISLWRKRLLTEWQWQQSVFQDQIGARQSLNKDMGATYERLEQIKL